MPGDGRRVCHENVDVKAAWCGGIGARGEFSEEHALLTAETDQLQDQLRALGGTLPLNPA